MKSSYAKIIVYSAFINILLLAAYLAFCSFYIEIPDNIAYSQFIAEGDYTFDYMDFFVCAFIGLIQKITYPLNAFVAVHFCFSYISFFVITFVFVHKFKYFYGTLLTIMIMSFYAVSHYGNLSFTRDAGLFCAAGFLLIVHFSEKKKCMVLLTVGGLLVLIGAQYRFQVFLVSSCIVAVFMFAESIALMTGETRKEKILSAFHLLFERRRLVSLLSVLFLCIVMHCGSVFINTSTPELSYYREYTYARQVVYDYPIPDYDDCKEEYDKIGFDQNDIDMNRAWYLDDSGAFTLTNLKELKTIRDDYSAQNKDCFQLMTKIISNEIGNLRGLGDKGIALFGFIVIISSFFLLMKKQYYYIPVCLSLAIFVFYYYLWNTDRNPPYRAVYMLWISSSIFILYSFRVDRLNKLWKKLANKQIIRGALISGVLLFATLGFYLSGIANFGTSKYNVHDYSVFLFEENSEIKKQTANFVNTYYQYTNTLRHMAEFGTDNMYSNLLNANVFFVCNSNEDHSDMMREYLVKYYEDNIKCKKIVTINNSDDFRQYLYNHPNDRFELSRNVTEDNTQSCVIYKYEAGV